MRLIRSRMAKIGIPVMIAVLAAGFMIAFLFAKWNKGGQEMEETPLFEEMNLFTPGEGGYPVFRIPGLVAARDGTLIAYAEARSSSSDWSKIDLVLKKSTDGGKSWGPLEIIVKNGPDESTTYNNPLMIAERGRNAVHFLYCKNYHEVFYMKSENGGKDWSEPVNLTETVFGQFRNEGQKPKPYAWKVVATGPGHGIELRNGRLLVPVWLANGPTDRSHGPSVAATIYSDDKGATWKAGEIVYGTEQVKNPGETTAVELADGSVMLNIRTSQNRRRSVTVSPDGVSGWSPLTPDDRLADPGNHGSTARYSFKEETGHSRILLINANDPEHRRNITLRMSEDEGRTWAYSRTIQPGQGAYSEVSVAPDQTIHVLYEKGFGIQAVRLNLAWVMSGSELDKLELDTGVLAPAFQSGGRQYVLNVREEIDSVQVMPKLPDHAAANVVKVNGTMVTDRTGLNVRLQESGDTEIRIAIESSEGEELNAYNLTVRKTLPRGRLVGYWNFDEISAEGIVKDQSGMGNDGNVYAAELVPGKTGHALRFSGGYVDVNHAKGLDFGDGDFTVSLWVKPERLDEFMTLLWYGDVGAGAKGWYVRTQQHDRLFFRTGGDGSETLAGTGKPVLAAGRWTHVAARKKGHVMNILIDGREALTKVSTLNYNINGEARLRIGMPKSGSSRAWAGLIDEVRIYNYALSDEEIQRLYDEWK